MGRPSVARSAHGCPTRSFYRGAVGQSRSIVQPQLLRKGRRGSRWLQWAYRCAVEAAQTIHGLHSLRSFHLWLFMVNPPVRGQSVEGPYSQNLQHIQRVDEHLDRVHLDRVHLGHVTLRAFRHGTGHRGHPFPDSHLNPLPLTAAPAPTPPATNRQTMRYRSRQRRRSPTAARLPPRSLAPFQTQASTAPRSASS